MTDTLTVICNASPDAGWPTLRDFFARTQQKLVVGMYDFTSAHVLAGLENALSGGGGARNLSLVLDHPTRFCRCVLDTSGGQRTLSLFA